MPKYIKQIPNMITLLRVVLSCLINIYICYNFGKILIPVVVTLVIFLTDFIDGKIARHMNITTRFGGIFDTITDLFYIIITYYVLYLYQVLPLWFLFVIFFKFAEFIITSAILNKSKKSGSSLVFDYVGRLAAVNFYVIPIFSYVTYHINSSIFSHINILLYIVVTLVFISTTYRIYCCTKSVKLPQKESNLNF